MDRLSINLLLEEAAELEAWVYRRWPCSPVTPLEKSLMAEGHLAGCPGPAGDPALRLASGARGHPPMWRSTPSPPIARTASSMTKAMYGNDITTEILVKQALSHAAARNDMVAPSDMMDVHPVPSARRWREQLRQRADHGLLRQNYASHYRSRSAMRWAPPPTSAKATRPPCQMDPASGNEPCTVALDIAEGADNVMVKPGMPYLDIIRRVKDQFGVPTFPIR